MGICILQLMTSPRCGVPDITRIPEVDIKQWGRSSPPAMSTTHDRRRRRRRKKIRRREKRFVVGARAWLKRRITYLWVPLLLHFWFQEERSEKWCMILSRVIRTLQEIPKISTNKTETHCATITNILLHSLNVSIHSHFSVSPHDQKLYTQCTSAA